MIKAIDRLREQASLNEEQITALRTRILPLFTEVLMSRDEWEILDRARIPYVQKAQYTFITLGDLLKAAVGKGSPVRRYAELKTALNYQGWAVKGVPVDKLLSKALALIKGSLSKKIRPEVKEDIQKFLTNPNIKLLKGSWVFITKELEKEVPEILKKYNLMAIPNKRRNVDYIVDDKFAEKAKQRFIEYTKSLGFVEVPKPLDDYPPAACVERKGDKGTVKLWIFKEGIQPRFRMNSSDWDSTWERSGVDSGIEYWYYRPTTVEDLVDKCIEKCEKAIEKKAFLENNGTLIDFGGRQKTLLPEDLKSVIDTLKSGRSYTIAPSGFGTAYIYSIYNSKSRWNDSYPASDQISKLVGKPVFYTKQDRD